MPPMFRLRLHIIIPTSLFLALTVSTVASAATAVLFVPETTTRSSETHPWDQSDRKHGSRRRSYRSTQAIRNDPYYRRTETYALHPYYRGHYDDILTVRDTSRRAESQRRFYMESFPYLQAPNVFSCSEYSYTRRNNRMPPTDFKCLRR